MVVRGRLLLKDPNTQLKIVDSLHKAELKAKPMGMKGKLDAVAVVLFDKNESDQSLRSKMNLAKSFYKMVH